MPDSAYDIKLIQRNAADDGNTEILVSPLVDSVLTFNASKLPVTLPKSTWQLSSSILDDISALTTTAFGLGMLETINGADMRTYIGAGVSDFDGVFASLTSKPTTVAGYGIVDAVSLSVLTSGYQPLDADLTALSSLTTTSAGRLLLTLDNVSPAVGDVPYFSGVSTISKITTTALGRTLVGQATTANMRTTLELGTLATQSGTISDYLTISNALAGYQPLDPDLTSIAALATNAFGRSLLTAASDSAARTLLGVTGSGGTQPLHANLTAISALTTTSYGLSFLTRADTAAAQAYIGIDVGVVGYDVLAATTAAAGRTALALGTLATQSATITDYLTVATAASTYQPLNSDLTAVAALTTNAFGLGLLEKVDAAAVLSYIGAGAGTVTTISVTTANGISGTVLTPTTTPAISLDITGLDATKIGAGTVTTTEFGYISTLTSNAQTQLNSKVDAGDLIPVSDGGTGLTTLTAHGVLLGNGGSAAVVTAAGSVGQALLSGGASADPGWFTLHREGQEVVTTVTATSTSTATTIPFDNTIPQDTEGDAMADFDTVFTPQFSTSTLSIEVEILLNSSATAETVVALFEDGVTSALEASGVTLTGTNATDRIRFTKRVSAATTSARTYTIRMGRSAAGTTTVNLLKNFTFGGVLTSSVRVTEILA